MADRGMTFLSTRGPALPRPSRSLVLGDLFGRSSLALLATGRPRELIVVEDGLAGLAAIEQVSRGEGLRRPKFDMPASALGRRAAEVVRRRAADDALTWVIGKSSMGILSDPARLIGRIVQHEFEWVRSHPADRLDAELRSATHLVVGSALAADGLINLDAYVDWVYRCVGRFRGGRTAFWPHRREPASAISAARTLGAYVPSTPTSIERVAPALRSLAAVDMLPGSVALTLRDLVPKTTELSVTPLDDATWNVHVGSGLASMFERLTSAH